MNRAEALMERAGNILYRIGPMPTMMVCEPCAAERKRAVGHDYVHKRIEDHHEQAAKRRRVE